VSRVGGQHLVEQGLGLLEVEPGGDRGLHEEGVERGVTGRTLFLACFRLLAS
jgi:hypothetical protein